MCGLVGIFGSLRTDAARTLQAMTNAIALRGPDGAGHWLDPNNIVALGHRRLSVIDPSKSGDQPMTSKCGQFVLVYNGELYNTEDLRSHLNKDQNIAWHGHSDTEVFLELMARLGVEQALQMTDGMFAFALYDQFNQTITLGRDAFGEKPLYYGLVGGNLVFASQLSAFHEIPDFRPTLNRQAVATYFKYSYIPAPLSVFNGVYKLPPAHMLTCSKADLKSDLPNSAPWWDSISTAIAARDKGFTGSKEQATRATKSALEKAVSTRMVSDVPLGCLLSGGIDSSMVAALMVKSSSRPIKTFCIGMQGSGFDEAPHARAVAQHLSADHTDLILTPKDVQATVPFLAEHYDEPFADSSQVPMVLVSQLAREQVTVALSGDGGDEVFGGYNRYTYGDKVWRYSKNFPYPVRKLFGAALNALPMGMVDAFAQRLGDQNPLSGRGSEKLKKLARVISAKDQSDVLDRMLSTGVVDVMSQPTTAIDLANVADDQLSNLPFAEQAMLKDTITYLPGDILAKVDRASMAHSLETRVPFLDRELFELAWSLPLDMRINGTTGKHIIRDILYDYVPQNLVDRPKAGFAMPIGRWLRTDLRAWAEDLLSQEALAKSGVLDVRTVRSVWKDHLSERHDHDSLLWSVLMFQGWYARWMA